MFAKKNSVTLAAIWAVLTIIGAYWYFSNANDLVGAVNEEKALQNALLDSQKKVRRLTQVEKIHADVNLQWKQAKKRIISADEPSFTLSYLNWIVATYSLNIYYDFVLNQQQKSADVTTFAYTLTGEGSYNDINRLIWHLTYEPILYIVESVNLRPNTDGEFVRFTMRLKGYSVDSKSEMLENFSEYQLSDVSTYQGQHDVFKPLILKPPVDVAARNKIPEKPTLPKKQPGEIDVAKASLKAVTASSIFISEGSGEMKQLRVGDSVYLGRLSEIDQNAGKAEFVLVKFGVSETVTLTIDQRK